MNLLLLMVVGEWSGDVNRQSLKRCSKVVLLHPTLHVCCRILSGSTSYTLSGPLLDIFSAMYLVESFTNLCYGFVHSKWAPHPPLCISSNIRPTYSLDTTVCTVHRRSATRSCSDSHWTHIAFSAGLSGDISYHPDCGLLSTVVGDHHRYLLVEPS